jgi:glyoxylase-like metal-dependent hydrolase (beta-lactamase superfamily II)
MLTISCFTGGIAQTNGYLVRTSQGDFAVDAPEGFAEWLKEQDARVGMLLLTHQHFDHVMDAAVIQREFGARVVAFAPFSRDLTLEAMFGFATGTRFSVPEFSVDEVLDHKASVEVGGMKWRVEHIPGHSSDSIVFINQDEKLIFSGDVLFEGSIGRCDFPGGNNLLLLAGIAKKLLPLPDDTVLFPGHGGSTTIGRERDENPYLVQA